MSSSSLPFLYYNDGDDAVLSGSSVKNQGIVYSETRGSYAQEGRAQSPSSSNRINGNSDAFGKEDGYRLTKMYQEPTDEYYQSRSSELEMLAAGLDSFQSQIEEAERSSNLQSTFQFGRGHVQAKGEEEEEENKKESDSTLTYPSPSHTAVELIKKSPPRRPPPAAPIQKSTPRSSPEETTHGDFTSAERNTSLLACQNDTHLTSSNDSSSSQEGPQMTFENGRMTSRHHHRLQGSDQITGTGPQKDRHSVNKQTVSQALLSSIFGDTVQHETSRTTSNAEVVSNSSKRNGSPMPLERPLDSTIASMRRHMSITPSLKMEKTSKNSGEVSDGDGSGRKVRVRRHPKGLKGFQPENMVKRSQTGTNSRRRTRSVDRGETKKPQQENRRRSSSTAISKFRKNQGKQTDTAEQQLWKKLLEVTKEEIQKYEQQLGDRTKDVRRMEARAKALENLVKSVSPEGQILRFNQGDYTWMTSHEPYGSQPSIPSTVPSSDSMALVTTESTRSSNAEKGFTRTSPSTKEGTSAASSNMNQGSTTTTPNTEKRSTMNTQKHISSPLSIQKELTSAKNGANEQRRHATEQTTMSQREAFARQFHAVFGRLGDRNTHKEKKRSSSFELPISSGFPRKADDKPLNSRAKSADILETTSEALKFMSENQMPSDAVDNSWRIPKNSGDIFRRVYGNVDAVSLKKQPESAKKRNKGSPASSPSYVRFAEERQQVLATHSIPSQRAPRSVPVNVRINKSATTNASFRSEQARAPPTLFSRTHVDNSKHDTTKQKDDHDSKQIAKIDTMQNASDYHTRLKQSLHLTDQLDSPASRHSSPLPRPHTRRNRSLSPRSSRKGTATQSSLRQSSYSGSLESDDNEHLRALLPEQEFRALCAMARSAWSSGNK